MEKLDDLRIAAGLTRVALARRANVSEATLRRLERGQLVRPEMIARVRMALHGVPFDSNPSGDSSVGGAR
jgi:transcriptional regulator with XRE-family HTH domain